MYKNSKKKIVAIIEARMASTRLPGKVLMPLAGKPALERLIERLRRSKYLDDVMIATTINSEDRAIKELADKLETECFRGSEKDVLKRVLEAAHSINADIIVEITGDCPLVDWRLVDKGIEYYFESGADYSSNDIRRSYPEGFAVQVFSVATLDKTDKLTNDPIDRVHVSYYIYQHPEIFKLHNWEAEGKMFWPNIRITLDEKEDYKLINLIFEKLLPIDQDFSADDIVQLLKEDPKLLEINEKIKSKEVFEG